MRSQVTKGGQQSMKCNLVKKVTIQEKEGNKRVFYHFYLEFENGLRVRISPEYIPTNNIKDESKIQRIQASNKANAISLNNMADLEK